MFLKHELKRDVGYSNSQIIGSLFRFFQSIAMRVLKYLHSLVTLNVMSVSPWCPDYERGTKVVNPFDGNTSVIISQKR